MKTIKVNKYLGSSIMNLYRHVVLTQLPETRPIAVKVGNFSNVLTISDTVEESMPEFIANVSTLLCEVEANGDIYKWSTTVDGILRAGDLDDGHLKILSPKDVEFLHCYGPVTVEIIFRTASGAHDRKDNEQFLEDHKYKLNEYCVFASRHSQTEVFSYDLVNSGENFEEYSLLVMPKAFTTVEGILASASRLMQRNIEGFIESMNSN